MPIPTGLGETGLTRPRWGGQVDAPEAFDTCAALHPVGCMGEIDDIVRCVLYLD
jgi:hypothetical protein